MEMNETPNYVWLKEEVLNLASSCQSYSEFQKKHRTAYFAAIRKGWKNDVLEILPSKYKITSRKTKYNIDGIKELAKNSASYIDFQNNYPKEYQYICYHKLIDQIKILFPTSRKEWDKSEIIIEAKKYPSRKKFQIGSKSAYNKALKQGWLDEVCSHMKSLVRAKWTLNEMIEISKNFETTSQFRKANPSLWQIARKNGWLDIITKNLIKTGSYYKRIIYCFEFPDNHVYVGLTLNHKDRFNDHKTKPESAVFQHIIHTGLNPEMILLTDYIGLEEAKQKELDFINKYKSEGWNVLNKAKAGGIGSAPHKSYSFEDVSNCAGKYVFYSDFRKENLDMYNQAKRRGFLELVTKNLVKQKKSWDKKTVTEDALKFSSRNEFKKNSSSAYEHARRNKFLDEICLHMKPKIS